MVRKLVWPVAAAGVALAIFAGLAVGNNGRQNDKTFQYTIGLWGDLSARPHGPAASATNGQG